MQSKCSLAMVIVNKASAWPVLNSVMSGIFQVSVLGPVLINISDTDTGTESTLCKFSNTDLSDVVDMPEEWDAIKRDQDRLKKWTHVIILDVFI